MGTAPCVAESAIRSRRALGLELAWGRGFVSRGRPMREGVRVECDGCGPVARLTDRDEAERMESGQGRPEARASDVDLPRPGAEALDRTACDEVEQGDTGVGAEAGVKDGGVEFSRVDVVIHNAASCSRVT